MGLQKYPLDSQKCPILIASCEYAYGDGGGGGGGVMTVVVLTVLLLLLLMMMISIYVAYPAS